MKVNDVDVKCFDGNYYVRLKDYEELLSELKRLQKELQEKRT